MQASFTRSETVGAADRFWNAVSWRTLQHELNCCFKADPMTNGDINRTDRRMRADDCTDDLLSVTQRLGAAARLVQMPMFPCQEGFGYPDSGDIEQDTDMAG